MDNTGHPYFDDYVDCLTEDECKALPKEDIFAKIFVPPTANDVKSVAKIFDKRTDAVELYHAIPEPQKTDKQKAVFLALDPGKQIAIYKQVPTTAGDITMHRTNLLQAFDDEDHKPSNRFLKAIGAISVEVFNGLVADNLKLLNANNFSNFNLNQIVAHPSNLIEETRTKTELLTKILTIQKIDTNFCTTFEGLHPEHQEKRQEQQQQIFKCLSSNQKVKLFRNNKIYTPTRISLLNTYPEGIDGLKEQKALLNHLDDAQLKDLFESFSDNRTKSTNNSKVLDYMIERMSKKAIKQLTAVAVDYNVNTLSDSSLVKIFKHHEINDQFALNYQTISAESTRRTIFSKIPSQQRLDLFKNSNVNTTSKVEILRHYQNDSSEINQLVSSLNVTKLTELFNFDDVIRTPGLNKPTLKAIAKESLRNKTNEDINTMLSTIGTGPLHVDRQEALLTAVADKFTPPAPTNWIRDKLPITSDKIMGFRTCIEPLIATMTAENLNKILETKNIHPDLAVTAFEAFTENHKEITNFSGLSALENIKQRKDGIGTAGAAQATSDEEELLDRHRRL